MYIVDLMKAGVCSNNTPPVPSISKASISASLIMTVQHGPGEQHCLHRSKVRTSPDDIDDGGHCVARGKIRGIHEHNQFSRMLFPPA